MFVHVFAIACCFFETIKIDPVCMLSTVGFSLACNSIFMPVQMFQSHSRRVTRTKHRHATRYPCKPSLRCITIAYAKFTNFRKVISLRVTLRICVCRFGTKVIRNRVLHRVNHHNMKTEVGVPQVPANECLSYSLSACDYGAKSRSPRADPYFIKKSNSTSQMALN